MMFVCDSVRPNRIVIIHYDMFYRRYAHVQIQKQNFSMSIQFERRERKFKWNLIKRLHLHFLSRSLSLSLLLACCSPYDDDGDYKFANSSVFSFPRMFGPIRENTTLAVSSLSTNRSETKCLKKKMNFFLFLFSSQFDSIP